MRKFLSFLGWFFGIIFLLGAIPYFWCGEFFLGLWSLVVVVVLIPPLYKYASGKLNSPFSKPKTLIFSLVVFVFLFANFVRPLFDKLDEKPDADMKQLVKINNYCSESIKINEFKKNDSHKLKCDKYINIYKNCKLTIDQTEQFFLKYEKRNDIQPIMKLSALVANKLFLPITSTMARKQLDITKKTIKYKWKCGDF